MSDFKGTLTELNGLFSLTNITSNTPVLVNADHKYFIMSRHTRVESFYHEYTIT